MQKKKALTIFSALLCVCSIALALTPEEITIDSQARVAPRLEVYRASAKTYRVTFKDGGTAHDATGETPFMVWYTNQTSAAVVTSSYTVVTAAVGLVDFAFDEVDFNYTPGDYYYAAGLTDSNSQFTAYRQGRLKITGEPYGAGASTASFTTNISDGLIPSTITRDTEWDTEGEVEAIWGTDIVTTGDTANVTEAMLAFSAATDAELAGTSTADRAYADALVDDLSGVTDAATARTNIGLVAGGTGDIWVEKASDTMTGDLTVGTNRVLYTGDYFDASISAGRIWGGSVSVTGQTIYVQAGGGLCKEDTISTLSDIPTNTTDGFSSRPVYKTFDATELTALEGYNIVFYDCSEAVITNILKDDFFTYFDPSQDFTVGRTYYDTVYGGVSRLCGMNAWSSQRRNQIYHDLKAAVEVVQGAVPSATGLKIGVTAGRLVAEGYDHFTTTAHSTNDTFALWYQINSAWTYTNTTTISNAVYNLTSGDADGFAAMLPNKWRADYVYLIHDGTVHVVMGQATYGSQTLAEDAAVPTPPGLLSAYGTIIARITVETSAASMTLDPSSTVAFSGGAVPDHNNLAGLQGGTTDEYYHWTSSDYTNRFLRDGSRPATGDLNMGNNAITAVKSTTGAAITATSTATAFPAISASGAYLDAGTGLSALGRVGVDSFGLGDGALGISAQATGTNAIGVIAIAEGDGAIGVVSYGPTGGGVAGRFFGEIQVVDASTNTICSITTTNIQFGTNSLTYDVATDVMQVGTISNTVLKATTVGDNLLPTSSNAYSLGSELMPWADLYVSTGTVYIGETRIRSDGTDGDLIIQASEGGEETAATREWSVASNILVDASGFDGNLTTDDDTIQEVAQKVDDLSLSGGGITNNAGTSITLANSNTLTETETELPTSGAVKRYVDTRFQGYIAGCSIAYLNTTSVTVQAGEGVCNGSFWSSATTQDVSLAISGEGHAYIYVDDDSSYPTPTYYAATNHPAWDATRMGLYNGDDRAVAAYYYSSDAIVQGQWHAAGNLLSFDQFGYTLLGGSMNPSATWQTPTTDDGSTYIPVGAIEARGFAFGLDGGSTVAVYIATPEFAAANPTASPANSLDSMQAYNNISFHWRVSVGDSRALRVSGEDDDANSLSISLSGWTLRR